MNKILKKIIFSFVVMIFFFSFIVVNAEGTGGFKIKREIHGVTNHTNNTFTYKVRNDNSNPAVATNLPTNISVTVDGDPDSANIVTGYSLIAGLKWQDINYPTLGTYKFLVTEQTSTDSTTYPLAQEVYYAYVFVSNEMDQNNQPTGNKLISYIGSKLNDSGSKILPTDATAVDPYTGEPVINPRNDTEYDNLYTSKAAFTSITVTNDVEGSQANPDKYFKFKIDIEGDDGDQYIITGQDPQVTFKGETIDTQTIYTVGEENYIYLRAGQTVTIGKVSDDIDQIRIGANYTVKLVDREDDGYTPSVDGDDTDTISGNTATNPKTNTVNFVNRKGFVLPKFIIKIVPFLLIILLTAVATYMIKKNHRQEKIRNNVKN